MIVALEDAEETEATEAVEEVVAGAEAGKTRKRNGFLAQS